jgi:hypothetical protein
MQAAGYRRSQVHDILPTMNFQIFAKDSDRT